MRAPDHRAWPLCTHSSHCSLEALPHPLSRYEATTHGLAVRTPPSAPPCAAALPRRRVPAAVPNALAFSAFEPCSCCSLCQKSCSLPFPSVCRADPPPFRSQLRGCVVQGSWVGVPLVFPGHPTRPPTTTGDGRLFMCPRDTSVPGLEGRLNGSTVKPGGSHWTPAPKQNGVMLEAEAATPWGCSRVGGGSGRAVERRP